MKIVFFEIDKADQKIFSSALEDDDVYFFHDALSEKNIQKVIDAEIISIFVCSFITKSIVESFPSLRLIATRSTGYDHIDLKAIAQRNIVACNVPVYADIAVAEYVFALLLSLSRKIYDAYYGVLHEHSFSTENLQGFDLTGKTIGIIGTGNIGKHVVRIAQGFNMRILAYDIFPDKAYASLMGFTYVDLDQLLATSDIITLHVPLNDSTCNMINSDTIALLKKGVYVINTARGGLIETRALIDALDRGIIAGAALDVLQEELYTRDPRLLFFENDSSDQAKTVLENYYVIQHPRVIVSPHNAFNSQQAKERLMQVTIDNIRAWKQGTPLNVIKKH